MHLAADDEVWMQYALNLADKAQSMGEVPVGALLVKDGKILGEGHNQPIATHNPVAHAEIVALQQAAVRIQNYRLVDTTLYVTLEPCLMCVGAMVHARVARVVFGAYDTRAGAVESAGSFLTLPFLNHKISVEGGVLAARCAEKLTAFFKARR